MAGVAQAANVGIASGMDTHSCHLYAPLISFSGDGKNLPMADVKLPFGLKDGQYFHVSQVDRGLSCNCRCPGCDAELVAKKGSDTAHHFAHRAKSDCTYRPETALHDYSKRLISRQSSFLTPSLRVTVQEHNYGFWIDDVIPGKKYAVNAAAFEKAHEDVVPDVQLETNAGIIFIEVAVTHFVDRDKRSKLRRIGVPTVEIDLSSVALDSSLELIEHAVLSDMSLRKWAYHPGEFELQSRLRKDLEAKVTQYESVRWDNASDDAFDDGRDEEDDYDGWALIESATDQYDGEAIHDWLQSVPPHERTERYKTLSHLDKLTYHCFLLERRPEMLPLLFNRRDATAHPFLCPSIVWRTAIFFRFVTANSKEFAVDDVVQWCRDRYDTLNVGAQLGVQTNIFTDVCDFLLELERDGYLNSDGFIAKRRRFVPTVKRLPNRSRLGR